MKLSRKCDRKVQANILPSSVFLCFLLLISFLLPGCAHAQTIDRGAAYRNALPLYQYDTHKALAVQIIETRTLAGCRFQRFSYLSTNGQRVPALLFTPLSADASHPAPCLILLHGLGGSKEMMAGLGLFAARAGYASLAIDLYGHGERLTAMKHLATPTENLGNTVQQTAVDVRRGIDYLESRRDIDSHKVGLVGISLGAIIGTVTAGVEERIKATALISGGGDWGLILRTLSARNTPVGGQSMANLKGLDWAKVNLQLAAEDPLTFAPQIAPRALLMLHGRLDDIIVPQSAQELFDAARQPKEIIWYPPYGHVPPPEVVYPALKAFFAKWL